ncbi:MAG TPA: hypothetical protein VLH38_02505 [Patescibacteria group bacterium]|nr:hypothetical protein [Patescibacteria group bacterium]
MFEHFMALIRNWATTTSDRQKLQHTYIVLMILVTLVAGVVTFLDAKKGHQVMYVVVLMAIAFLANAVVWNLLNSAFLSKLTPTVERRKK